MGDEPLSTSICKTGAGVGMNVRTEGGEDGIEDTLKRLTGRNSSSCDCDESITRILGVKLRIKLRTTNIKDPSVAVVGQCTTNMDPGPSQDEFRLTAGNCRRLEKNLDKKLNKRSKLYKRPLARICMTTNLLSSHSQFATKFQRCPSIQTSRISWLAIFICISSCFYRL